MRSAASGLVSVRRLRATGDLTKSHAPPEARHAPRSVRRPHAPWLVLGEVHHQTRGGRAPDPTWLTTPQRGLYTGLMILGAVGTDKTSACMYRYVDQLLRWRSREADHKLGGLVMEVRGDFCRRAENAAPMRRRSSRGFKQRQPKRTWSGSESTVRVTQVYAL
jgi:hypothetical protein